METPIDTSLNKNNKLTGATKQLIVAIENGQLFGYISHADDVGLSGDGDYDNHLNKIHFTYDEIINTNPLCVKKQLDKIPGAQDLVYTTSYNAVYGHDPQTGNVPSEIRSYFA